MRTKSLKKRKMKKEMKTTQTKYLLANKREIRTRIIKILTMNFDILFKTFKVFKTT